MTWFHPTSDTRRCVVRSCFCVPSRLEPKPRARARQILVHGAIPIVLPCVAFRPQVGAIFTWLIAPANATASTDAAAAADASVVAVLDVMQASSG